MLAILIAFPTVLLDSTSERVSDHIEQRRLARTGAAARRAICPPPTLLGWSAATGGLLVAAAASTVVDPDFALDAVGAFLLVLIPLPDSWQLVELDLAAWGIGYATYLVVAVAAWLMVARPWVRDVVNAAPATGHAAD